MGMMVTGYSPGAPVAGAVQDLNAVLLQGVLTAIQAMTQMNMQSDQRNANMTGPPIAWWRSEIYPTWRASMKCLGVVGSR